MALRGALLGFGVLYVATACAPVAGSSTHHYAHTWKGGSARSMPQPPERATALGAAGEDAAADDEPLDDLD